MKSLWPTLGWYAAFSTFVFYQQLHAKHFQGDSEGFQFVLNLSVILGTLTGFAILGYSAWAYAWWAPLAMLVTVAATSGIGFFIERHIGVVAISLLGFVGWPVTAWFMFRALRHAVS